jgi:hypothetical protein
MPAQSSIIPKTIETLADAVYPSFALLAGMELDLFTPLKDGPRLRGALPEADICSAAKINRFTSGTCAAKFFVRRLAT